MVEKVCSRAVILSAGRVAAEHAVTRDAEGDRDALERLFVRVTAQDDYQPVAQRILDLVQA
jgi:hypothetical protein